MIRPTHRFPRRATAPLRRAGGIYIAVLAAVLVVTLIGMSAVLAARIERRAGVANDDAVRARFYARSFAEIVLQRLQADDTWRTRYANKSWTGTEDLDDIAKVRFCVTDEADGDLTDDSTEPFRIQTAATYRSATRCISMLVQPPSAGSGGSPPSKLENAGMETFTSSTLPPTRWYHYPSGPVETSSSAPRAGARNARVYNRTGIASGLSQDLPVTSIRKGATYDMRAFVKYATVPGTVKVALVLTDSTGTTTKFALTRLASPSVWYEVSGSVTPTWSGTLTAARFSVESVNGTGELRVDDALLAEQRLSTSTLAIVSGSIRRDLAE